MAITREQYNQLRANGYSHDDIASGNYEIPKNFLQKTASALISPVTAGAKVFARGGQAIAGLGLKAGDVLSGGAISKRVQDIKGKTLDEAIQESLQKERRLPAGLGTLKGLSPDRTGKQILGETVSGVSSLGLAGFTPALKPATTFVQGLKSGFRAIAPVSTGLGALQELGESISEGRGIKETLGRAVGAGLLTGTTAGFLGGVVSGVAGSIAGRIARKKELLKIFQDNPQDARVAQYTKRGLDSILGKDNLVKDKVAQSAIDAGVDRANVALFKGVGNSEKKAFSRMLDIFEKGRKDAKFRALNRPSDVVGEPVINQAKVLVDTIKKSGKELDDIASGLKDNFVDIPLNSIEDDLLRVGASIDNKGKIDFSGSDFADLPFTRDIERVFNRISKARDALDIHRAKRYIDNIVEYGKTSEGLTGEASNLLKGWRRLIDQSLDSQYPAYNKVNTKLSTAFNGLDSLYELAGSKFKVGDDFATAKIGQISRGILSNSKNRTDLLTRLDEIQKAAQKLGYKEESDVISRVIFFDEMERLFGTQAPTGFQGQAARAIEQATDTGKLIKSTKQGGITAGAVALAEKAVKTLSKKDQTDYLIKLLRDLIK